MQGVHNVLCKRSGNSIKQKQLPWKVPVAIFHLSCSSVDRDTSLSQRHLILHKCEYFPLSYCNEAVACTLATDEKTQRLPYGWIIKQIILSYISFIHSTSNRRGDCDCDYMCTWLKASDDKWRLVSNGIKRPQQYFAPQRLQCAVHLTFCGCLRNHLAYTHWNTCDRGWYESQVTI